MRLNFWKYLILICMPVISSLGPFLVEGQAADHVFFDKKMVNFEFAEMKKHPNGQVSQTFIIRLPEDQAGQVSVLFQENQNPEVYTASFDKNTFTVYVDKPTCIRLFVFAGTDKMIHVVHTDIVLFGKSRSLAQRTLAEPSAAAVLKKLPYIALVSDKNVYWHQTGIPLTFSLKADFHIPVPVKLNVVDKNQNKVLAPTKKHPLQFVYTPAHDDQLRQSGSTAVKQTILSARFVRPGPSSRFLSGMPVIFI